MNDDEEELMFKVGQSIEHCSNAIDVLIKQAEHVDQVLTVLTKITVSIVEEIFDQRKDNTAKAVKENLLRICIDLGIFEVPQPKDKEPS